MVAGGKPARTEDGRYLLIGGRHWRASDPSIPEALRKQLVRELMAARRAVRAARDEASERQARSRVSDAKVALGERGEPWWEPSSDEGRRERLTACMRALLRSRDPDSTICPSEPARAIGGDQWRELLELAREVAAEEAGAKALELRSGGEMVENLQLVRGPLRIGRGESFPASPE